MRAPVEVLHQLEAFLLINQLPFFGFGWLEGVIDFHRAAQELYPLSHRKHAIAAQYFHSMMSGTDVASERVRKRGERTE
jgi:hypothetical protein